jgi:1,4-alpha-glucan branching enzyme
MTKEKTRENKPLASVPGRLTDYDIYLLKQGSHFRLFDKLGSHVMEVDGKPGTHFSVWAPNAESVSLVGDFNGWNPQANAMTVRQDGSAVWETFLPGVKAGAIYKYHMRSRHLGYRANKADPFAVYCEVPPRTGSVVWDLQYKWNDDAWMAQRKNANARDAPMSIYEVHLGSWRRIPEEGNRFLTYRELAATLPQYVQEMGFTHVELMPVTEHPFYGSWGYQCTGFFAPTARYGTPEDFMFLVDALHQHGIGLILDWVPSHFPNDEHGLAYFDGTHLFEHADPRQGFHPEWSSHIFNYGRHEVRSFLGSSALFWLERYHIDGLRVDAVASMLYLDYARQPGEWIPNEYGGKENIAAINFLRSLNEAVYGAHPDVQTTAEESTAWPMVSRPTTVGGLGFGYKWNMGWMHDNLSYLAHDPVHRKYHHNELTFSLWYAFTENFILPLSHDEVVHGKGSLFSRMPGDDWQRFANLRLLFGYLYAHPGKKLLFMGGEFGQRNEWYHESSLDWHLLNAAPHHGLQRWVRDLNHLYRRQPALYEIDFDQAGFQWIDAQDWEDSVISFLRKAKDPREQVLVVCNFTPVPRTHYRIGVPADGYWRELLNSDAREYGGSGQGNAGGAQAAPVAAHGHYHSLVLTLPPLSILVLKNAAAPQ